MSPRSESPNRRWQWAAAALAGAMLAAPAPLTAQSAPPAPNPTAEEVLARYVEARGGIEKLRSLQTLREEGRVHAGPGRDGLVTREVKRPGKIRIEFTVQGVTEVFASDGQRGWTASPRSGAKGPQLLSADEVVDARENSDPEGGLVDWKAKGITVVLVGREAVDGHDAWKLKLTRKGGDALTAWMDAKSALLLRTETERKLGGKAVRIERVFGDYRKVDGILFPHLVEIRTSGRPQVYRVVVDKVEVNPPLADARFSPPAVSASK